MHILIGILTTLVTLLYLLERLGVDLGWLNPWAWKRRRAWLKQSKGNPAYGLDKPIDAIALIATAAAKIDGDLSIEEKNKLKSIFRTTFNQSEKDATQLLVVSVHLLGSGEEIFQSPERVLKRSIEDFTDEQRNSSIDLLNKVINVGGSPSKLQEEFLGKVKKLMLSGGDKKTW
ncbi:hypothetical protein GCM10011352_34970 [Marinobacterium zhoushanense]|uniref:Tellurite resistance protein TerB n=1 Tax=Marinobacterium zhoushanense TaxID=1679163 RepID=A0ABQ1KPK6_9GAMM|nr:TerB family tellurite resistance protein [Marinobacterium zhoushanense]GGC05779.1 hypothetical protein GCM10011352_34970 [Marinobacterium zhoushanense]